MKRKILVRVLALLLFVISLITFDLVGSAGNIFFVAIFGLIVIWLYIILIEKNKK